MIEPKRVGRFLATDQWGHVQPDVSVELIGLHWRPLVEFVASALTARDGVLSVYVRGSIPRGLAVPGVSDVDFIYLSELAFELADLALEEEVKARFPLVAELKLFRLSRAEFNRTHPPQRRPYFHMLIKTQSLRLAGEDLVKHVEPFKIGLDMVSHIFALANEFARSRQWLSKLPPLIPDDQKTEIERSVRRWISKRIVRAGFEATMDRTDRYTRDLYLCYEQFCSFYPRRASQMYDVLKNSLNGGENVASYAELVRFLTSEGDRLLATR
jgi:predicted nucleotidyltransferase